jgi:hypothetical protein
MAKDTVYRFLNSVHTNWRRFLLLLLLRQLNMSILCGISNLWMTEVTTDMCRPFDESPHK